MSQPSGGRTEVNGRESSSPRGRQKDLRSTDRGNELGLGSGILKLRLAG